MFTSPGRMLEFFVTLLAFSAANAQSAKSLPGCEPPRELRIAMREQLDPKKFEGMKTYERMARRVEIIQALMEKFPREVDPAHDLIWYAWYGDLDLLPALQQSFKAREKENPSDPVAVYWSGYSRFWDDAPEAIRKFERARKLAPDSPWPYLGLAELYGRGKTRDLKALSENIAAYFNLCPSSTDAEAQRWLATEGNHDRMSKVATAIRARLRDKTDPVDLQSYETLWGLEFLTRPPTEHEALRARVSDDLKRLETLVPAPDAEFQSFLIRGYKQSGASAETVRAKEDRLLQEFPKSSEALRVTEKRWNSSHKEPEDQSDTAAWERYNQQYQKAREGWSQQFTDDYGLSHYGWKELVDSDGALSEKEVLALFESDVREAEEAEYPSLGSVRAAQSLLKRKVRPELAMATLEKARKLQVQERTRDGRDTNRSADDIAEAEAGLDLRERYIVAEMLTAARQLKRPELVEKMRTEITTPPTGSQFVWMYWICRARLAILDGHNADALAYYQLANQTSPAKPQMRRGKFWDDEGDETRALWKEMGGTDEAWQVWRKQPDTSQQAAEGFWTKPNKQLPDFALTDMSGKTWSPKDLAGRATLINVWATWCGPCNAELPHIEKLYQMTKERKDIQVVTFNLDENPGLVQPFLKEHQYKFPVLLAHSFLNAMLDRIGIPQNWIVDPKGKWVSTAIGFGSENDWEGNVVRRLEAVHKSSEDAFGTVAAQE
ncbi:MAG: redoxin family protein [Acidobacteriota bacterium]|nr:redoxin family protein [Acidobacteriota bacterium]